MYRVKFTSAYKRAYKKMKNRGLDITLLDEVVDRLRRGEKLAERYRDHALTGNFHGFRECHVKPDWLLIYMIEEDILTLTLVNTGSHADVLDL